MRAMVAPAGSPACTADANAVALRPAGSSVVTADPTKTSFSHHRQPHHVVQRQRGGQGRRVQGRRHARIGKRRKQIGRIARGIAQYSGDRLQVPGLQGRRNDLAVADLVGDKLTQERQGVRQPTAPRRCRLFHVLSTRASYGPAMPVNAGPAPACTLTNPGSSELPTPVKESSRPAMMPGWPERAPKKIEFSSLPSEPSPPRSPSGRRRRAASRRTYRRPALPQPEPN
jgi:hypothetical protein